MVQMSVLRKGRRISNVFMRKELNVSPPRTIYFGTHTFARGDTPCQNQMAKLGSGKKKRDLQPQDQISGRDVVDQENV